MKRKYNEEDNSSKVYNNGLILFVFVLFVEFVVERNGVLLLLLLLVGVLVLLLLPLLPLLF